MTLLAFAKLDLLHLIFDRKRGTFEAWMIRIAYNVAMDVLAGEVEQIQADLCQGLMSPKASVIRSESAVVGARNLLESFRGVTDVWRRQPLVTLLALDLIPQGRCHVCWEMLGQLPQAFVRGALKNEGQGSGGDGR